MHRPNLVPILALLAFIATAAQAASINYGGSGIVAGLVDEAGTPIDASNPLDVSGTVTQAPSTTGGVSTYSANVTTAGAGAGVGGVSVKASVGQVYGYMLMNNNATVCYIQFFDVAQATVNLGTTAPKLSVGIPANGGANVAFPNGIAFATAITIGVTTTRAGSTACTTGLDINITYK